MTQVAVPVADGLPQEWTKGGAFVLPNFFDYIDEGVDTADDGATQLSTSIAAVARFKLTALTDPGTNAGHFLRVRHRAPRDTVPGFEVWVYQGRTLLFTVAVAFAPVWSTTSLSLSAADIALITDYTDVYIELHCLGATIGAIFVSALELTCPSVSTASVQVMRQGIEVISLATAGVSLEVLRLGFEAMSLVPYIEVYRQGIEVMSLAPASSDIEVLRQGIEVVSRAAGNLQVMRQGVEVMALVESRIELLRQGIEVMSLKDIHPPIIVMRQGIEVVARKNALSLIQILRQGIEVMSFADFDGVKPLALPAALASHMLANWAPGVSMETAWETDITDAQDTIAEERRSLVGRPTRSIEATLTGLTRADVSRLWMKLNRAGQDHALFPLYQDTGEINEYDPLDNKRKIKFDARYRRFYIGQRVVMHGWGSDRRPAFVQYLTVSSVGIDFINVAEKPEPAQAVGWRIIPLIDVDLTLRSAATFITDQVGDVKMAGVEVAGPSALPPTLTAEPTSVVFDGYPVMSVFTDWGESLAVILARAGDQFRVGTTSHTEPRGSRPRVAYALRVRFLQRAAGWAFLEWFDSRRGRGKPFWMIGPQTVLVPVAITNTYVDVEVTGVVDDYTTFVPAIAIVLNAGGFVLRRVTSADDLGDGTVRLRLSSAISAMSLDTVRRVAVAHLGRFDSDAITEEWETSEVGEFRTSFLDLLVERVATIGDATQ